MKLREIKEEIKAGKKLGRIAIHRITLIKKGRDIGKVPFKCPNCGHEITLIFDANTGELPRTLPSATYHEETDTLSCPVCETIIELDFAVAPALF